MRLETKLELCFLVSVATAILALLACTEVERSPMKESTITVYSDGQRCLARCTEGDPPQCNIIKESCKKEETFANLD
jgi:hypothetical protein